MFKRECQAQREVLPDTLQIPQVLGIIIVQANVQEVVQMVCEAVSFECLLERRTRVRQGTGRVLEGEERVERVANRFHITCADEHAGCGDYDIARPLKVELVQAVCACA